MPNIISNIILIGGGTLCITGIIFTVSFVLWHLVKAQPEVPVIIKSRRQDGKSKTNNRKGCKGTSRK